MLIFPPELRSIAADSVILTPNHRLKRSLLSSWPQQCGISPEIYSLQQWLDQLWLDYQSSALPNGDLTVISASQSLLLWQQILTEQLADADLIAPQQLALQAEYARRDLALWQLDDKQLDQYPGDGSLPLKRWLEAYRTRLEQLGLVSQEQTLALLEEHGQIRKRPTYLYSFDQIAPAHRQLIDAVASEVHEIKAVGVETARAYKHSETNEDEQIRACARWAEAKLKSNPRAQIAIIVPELGQCRDKIERIFCEQLWPQQLFERDNNTPAPFNFSAGTPLAQTPLICDTLQLLELQHCERLSQQQLQALLFSPFYSDLDGERALRSAALESCLRRGRLNTRFARLLQLLQRLAEQYPQATKLSTRLQQFHTTARPLARQRHSAARWRELFERQLDALNWPGNRRLSSLEHQQMIRWHELLDEFAGLSLCQHSLSLLEAVSTLRRLAQHHHFQAQTPPSPIQVLGGLEAAGLNFDYAWVLNMDAKRWPASPAPNPLVPIELQRQQQMPRASAERELQLARRLTENFKHCAGEVVFSWAASDGDTPAHPSRLIAALPDLEQTTTEPAPKLNLAQFQQKLLDARQLLRRTDSSAPPLSERERQLLKGGSSLLRDQASCPLIAFAKHRLKAREPATASFGLSAIDRGNLLHEVLEYCWRELGDSTELARRDTSAIEALCTRAAEQSLRRYRAELADELPEMFFNLEQQRLSQLASLWLETERTRAPFRVIGLEQELQIEFEGLPLTLRLDRIDAVSSADNSAEQHLLVDYKTGQPKLQSWQSARPADPQLPLYAITTAPPPSAIAFAQINKRQMRWLGLGELTRPIDGIAAPGQISGLELADNWAEQLDNWRVALKQLACDFKAGCASADYRDADAERYSEAFAAFTRTAERETIARLTPADTAGTTAGNTADPQGELF